MRAVLFAYHDVGCRAIERLIRLKVEIPAVFTHAEDQEENHWFGSVEKLCRERNIPAYTPQSVNLPEWIQKIKSLNPDILFSFYYRSLICKEILDLAPLGAYNLHGSLLPKYRGRVPINWAVINGETESGMTLHAMVEKADAGDIVSQKKVKIDLTDTAHDLFLKLLPLTDLILSETIPQFIAGTLARTPQNHALATVYGRRCPEDGRIDWTKSAQEIYNLVRGVTHPYPGSFTHYNGKKVYIWQAVTEEHNANEISHYLPGQVVSCLPLTVQCGKGQLVILRSQSEEEEDYTGSSWAKTHQVSIGSQF